MTEYVAGFLFSQDRRYVVLIRKNRPAWQAGKLNGIGGHVEQGETPHDAMVREFWEETGRHIKQWELFNTLRIPQSEVVVHFFRSFTSSFLGIHDTTDEHVMMYPANNLPANVMTNLPWLIQMALSMDNERAAYFNTTEVAA